MKPTNEYRPRPKRTPNPNQQPKRMMPEPSPQDDAVTAKALLEQLEKTHGCELPKGQLKVKEATLRIGALNLDAGLAFEIHPKAGGLNSGLRRKVCADILKLSLLRRHFKEVENKDISVGIVLADQDSVDSLLGKKGPSWVREAALLHEVSVTTLSREE